MIPQADCVTVAQPRNSPPSLPFPCTVAGWVRPLMVSSPVISKDCGVPVMLVERKVIVGVLRDVQ